jgi:DNA-binding IclR family transcriptional regulator
MTPKTTTRRSALLRELAGIRACGLATEREEVSIGLACFAAYIGVTPLGKRVAVSTSVPLGRLDARREKQIATAIARVASRIAATL